MIFDSMLLCHSKQVKSSTERHAWCVRKPSLSFRSAEFKMLTSLQSHNDYGVKTINQCQTNTKPLGACFADWV